MKIKTIVHNYPDHFDDLVNEALEEGYLLEHRGLMPPNRAGETLHYAQLVLPDPPAEPAPFDPGLALHQVQTFCHSIPVEKCNAGDCPLRYWCAALEGGGDPTDWDLSEVVPF